MRSGSWPRRPVPRRLTVVVSIGDGDGAAAVCCAMVVATEAASIPIPVEAPTVWTMFRRVIAVAISVVLRGAADGCRRGQRRAATSPANVLGCAFVSGRIERHGRATDGVPGGDAAGEGSRVVASRA